MTITVDGTKIQVKPPDLDMNGVTGGIEIVESKGSSFAPINQISELGDSLREINKDEIEGNMGMSGVDMRSRLHLWVLPPITAIDSLVSLRVYPHGALFFCRQWKRNCVSLDGLGRREHVEMVAGKRQTDADKNLSLFDKMKEHFKKGDKQ